MEKGPFTCIALARRSKEKHEEASLREPNMVLSQF
jgi:hypothetical protein